ncbi:MAG: hypothetical protein KGZ33_04455 [Alkaliphilus sp.]|nr:hypothetical protein [Alkaliphilus sp.]
MKTDKRNSPIRILGIFVIFALAGGLISFGIFNYRQAEELRKSEYLNKGTSQEVVAIGKNHDIEAVLEGDEEVFLESYFGPDDLIELDDQDSDAIIKMLRDLDIKLLLSGDNIEIDYLYAIHVKSKNLKFKVNDDNIYIETLGGEKHIYSVKEDQVQHLNAELETIYMRKYNDVAIFNKAQKALIVAADEKREWSVESDKMKELQENILLMAPIDSSEAMGIPILYPNYSIVINSAVGDYIIQLMNSNTLSIDSSDNISFFSYDSKLWDYITNQFPINADNNIKGFNALLKSEKVVIDAVDDSFDMEDANYYHIEIPRYIINSNKEVLDEPIKGENLIVTMYFTVNHEIIEVKVYENQIMFQNKIYYIEKIGEGIKSFMSV